jgi:hypothetical protein
MIDLLNRIGFRQIAFGGEGGGGGGGARGMPAASNNVVKNAALRKNIMNQPHKLAYITPQEEQMLKENGGTGEMVNGIPAFRPVKGKTSSGKSSAGTGFSGGSSSTKTTPAPRDDRQPVSLNLLLLSIRPPPGSSNDDNVILHLLLYIRLLLLYIRLQILLPYTTSLHLILLYTTTPDPVTVSPTDTSNVYDFL